MVHNHYLEEAKKKTQESHRNSRPSVMPSARSQTSTANGSKPKPRINNQNSRNWPSSKTKQTSVAKKPERQIPKGHRFSIKRTSVVHEKTMTPRSCLRWKPTGKILKTVSLRWDPTGKIFTSSTTKVDSTLNLSVAMTSDHNSLELEIHDHSNEPSNSKLVPKVVPPADKTATPRQELELLFHHHITMLSKSENKGIVPTEMELVLEQTQQVLPEHPSDTYVFTMKMEILLEPTSNKLMVVRLSRTSKVSDFDVLTLEDPTFYTGKSCQGDFLKIGFYLITDRSSLDWGLSKDGDADTLFQQSTDKSKITRKQSKASKHGHENQKSTKKPSPQQSLSKFSSPRAILAFLQSYL
ncbi:hypothetical protein Tco_0236701 [Tanacetum coccineum]